MRYVLIGISMMVFMVVALAGFRGDLSRKPPLEMFPDMDRQPKLRPLEPNRFFAKFGSKNGMSSQPLVKGTVPRSEPLVTAKDGDVFSFEANHPVNKGYTIEGGQTNFVAAIPLPVTPELVQRGQARFNISCVPCHGGQGLGEASGVVGNFGFGGIKSLHGPTTVKLADGAIFKVISEGQNAMKGYSTSLSVRDRWAIVSYVRALQLSRLGRETEVPPHELAKLNKPAAKPESEPESK